MSTRRGRCLEFYPYLKSEQGHRRTRSNPDGCGISLLHSRFALFLLLPLVLPPPTPVYIQVVWYQQPSLYLCFSVLSLFFPFPLTISKRPFPFLLLSPQLSSHVLLLCTFRFWYIYLVHLIGKGDSATKTEEYRMRMLNTERAFRWSEWDVTPPVIPSFFPPCLALLSNFCIFFMCLCMYLCKCKSYVS